MATKQQTVTTLRAMASRITAHARHAAEVRALTRADPTIHPDLMPRVLADHRAEVATERQGMTAAAHQIVGQYRDANVLRTMPDPRPATAALASSIAGTCAMAPHFSPAVLGKTISDASERGNVALVAALMPLLESLTTYSKPFVNSPDAIAALVSGRQCLSNQPEVVASNEAKDFAELLDFEIGTLETVLNGDAPIAGLEEYAKVQALPNILPSVA